MQSGRVEHQGRQSGRTPKAGFPRNPLPESASASSDEGDILCCQMRWSRTVPSRSAGSARDRDRRVRHITSKAGLSSAGSTRPGLFPALASCSGDPAFGLRPLLADNLAHCLSVASGRRVRMRRKARSLCALAFGSSDRREPPRHMQTPFGLWARITADPQIAVPELGTIESQLMCAHSASPIEKG